MFCVSRGRMCRCESGEAFREKGGGKSLESGTAKGVEYCWRKEKVVMESEPWEERWDAEVEDSRWVFINVEALLLPLASSEPVRRVRVRERKKVVALRTLIGKALRRRGPSIEGSATLLA